MKKAETNMQSDVDEVFGGSDSARSEPTTIEEPTVLPDSPGGAEKGGNLFPQFTDKGNPGAQQHDIDMILDIPVTLMVELGRTRIPIKTILSLAQGSVIELDTLAGEPMDVLVNGFLIAQGEVVVVNDKFGIRLTDVVTPSERLRRLNR
ncbi:MAG: flagellar motor switch protein FliN [Burkholderiales bacterium]